MGPQNHPSPRLRRERSAKTRTTSSMNLKILFHNVRGLNDLSAIDNLCNYSQRNLVDILFLQEHKLQGVGATNLAGTLWKRALTYVTDAESGYTRDGSLADKGGIATLISPRWCKLISSLGSLQGGRAQWCILSKIPGVDLGFLNLYAPNDPHARWLLWESLARELPTSCH